MSEGIRTSMGGGGEMKGGENWAHEEGEFFDDTPENQEMNISEISQTTSDLCAAYSRARTEAEKKTRLNELIQFIETFSFDDVVSMADGLEDSTSELQRMPREAVMAYTRRMLETFRAKHQSEKEYAQEALLLADRELGHLVFFRMTPHSRKSGSVVFYDQLFVSLVQLSDEFPDEVDGIMNSMSQQSQMIDQKLFLSTAMDVISDPRKAGGLRDTLVAALNYNVTFMNSGFIFDQLDRAATDGETDALVALKYVAETGQQWHFSEESSVVLARRIERVAQTANRYLVRLRAEGVVGETGDIVNSLSTENLESIIRANEAYLEFDMFDEYGPPEDPDEYRLYLMDIIVQNEDILMPVLRRVRFHDVKTEAEDEIFAKNVDIPELNRGATMMRRIAKDAVGIYTTNMEFFGYLDQEQVAASVAAKTPVTIPLSEVHDVSRERGLFFGEKNPEVQRRLLSEFRLFEQYNTRQRIEADFGVQLDQLTIQEQLGFCRFLTNKRIETVHEVQQFTHTFKEAGLRIFLLLEFDENLGEKLFAIWKAIGDEHMKELVVLCGTSLSAAEADARSLVEHVISDTAATEDREQMFRTLREGLLVHKKDVLSAGYTSVQQGKGAQDVVAQMREGFARETVSEQAESGLFRRLADGLFQAEANSVSLRAYDEQSQKLFAGSDREAALFLRALQSRGELRPIPEIHWRVDRTNAEYMRRFGFSPIALLEQLKETGRKKVLVEFGPGNGKSKQERAMAGLSTYYIDIGHADVLYYPISGLVERIINWEKLARDAGGKLDHSDIVLLSDAIAKILMIKDGETEQEHFSYAERVTALSQQPEKIGSLLREIAPVLQTTAHVPSTISKRDAHGNVYYPNKISLEDGVSAGVIGARQLLSTRMEEYLRDDTTADIYSAIPAYPQGTVIGDFSRVKSLKDNQIDVAIGVRSTVYKRGEDYVDFMGAMADKLADGGVYVDDNIRDNDGWYYRLGEMKNVLTKYEERKAKKEISYDLSVSLILGPGFPGEDYQAEAVPLAMIMAKNGSYDDQVKALLMDHRYEVVPFTEYVKDSQRIRHLDETGKTVTELQAA